MERDAEEILNELLVLDAQRGDAGAIRRLVDRWHPQLVRYALKLTDRDDVAADIVQEGWIAIFRGFHRLHDPAAFRRWAYRIVRNKSVDWIRRQSRRNRVDREVHEQSTPAVCVESVEEQTDVDKLRHAIDRLSREQQVLLQMFYHDNMPLKEIASILDVPVGTLKFRLFKLRGRLKELIDATEIDDA